MKKLQKTIMTGVCAIAMLTGSISQTNTASAEGEIDAIIDLGRRNGAETIMMSLTKPVCIANKEQQLQLLDQIGAPIGSVEGLSTYGEKPFMMVAIAESLQVVFFMNEKTKTFTEIRIVRDPAGNTKALCIGAAGKVVWHDAPEKYVPETGA